VGGPRTGIVATRDANSVLAREADAVAYFGPNMMQADANMANIEAALRAGKNVVDTSMGIFHYPPLIPAALRERIAQACEAGGTSFFSNGIDPGFANDLFPMTLLGLCGQVESVRTTEFIDGGSYPDQASLRFMGLYSKMEETPPLEANPGMMTGIWGGPLYMIAEAVGVHIERTQENYSRWTGTRAVEFEHGRVLPGETAAHRIELQGIVDGRPRIIIDHVHRLYPDAAPDWPRPTTGRGSRQPRRDHRPPQHCPGDGLLRRGHGRWQRRRLPRHRHACIQRDPRGVRGPPGILSALDLPLIAGRGGMHEDGMRRGA
jgi:hypothetical protein